MMSGTISFCFGFALWAKITWSVLCRESMLWHRTVYTLVWTVSSLSWQKTRSLLHTNNTCGLLVCSDHEKFKIPMMYCCETQRIENLINQKDLNFFLSISLFAAKKYSHKYSIYCYAVADKFFQHIFCTNFQTLIRCQKC